MLLLLKSSVLAGIFFGFLLHLYKISHILPYGNKKGTHQPALSWMIEFLLEVKHVKAILTNAKIKNSF